MDDMDGMDNMDSLCEKKIPKRTPTPNYRPPYSELLSLTFPIFFRTISSINL